MVYTVLYKTSSFAGYCFLDKNSIHPKGYGVFSFKAFKAVLVKIQICSFIVIIKETIRKENIGENRKSTLEEEIYNSFDTLSAYSGGGFVWNTKWQKK